MPFDLKGCLKFKKHGIRKHINQAGNDNDADHFMMIGQFAKIKSGMVTLSSVIISKSESKARLDWIS